MAASGNFLNPAPAPALTPVPVLVPVPAPAPVSSSQVSDNQYWIRLSLGNNLHGTQSVRDILIKDFHIPNDGRLLHSWLATAKLNKKCCIQRFVWVHLLGPCNGGCTQTCNKETNLDDLDMTSLNSMYNNAEHIIPPHVLSQIDIQNLKTKYQPHIDSIKATRNDLAHYSFNKTMPKPEFDDRWIKIRNTLVPMGYNQIKLFDDLENCSLDPHLEKQVKVIVDTFNVLVDDKCNKNDFNAFKLLISSKIKQCEKSNIQNKTDLSSALTDIQGT